MACGSVCLCVCACEGVCSCVCVCEGEAEGDRVKDREKIKRVDVASKLKHTIVASYALHLWCLRVCEVLHHLLCVG